MPNKKVQVQKSVKVDPSQLLDPSGMVDRAVKMTDNEAAKWFESEAKRWAERSGETLSSSRGVLSRWLYFFALFTNQAGQISSLFGRHYQSA